MPFGVWAELMSDAEIAAALPALAAAGAQLGLALPSERLGDASLARLTRDAQSQGVPVRAWLLLPRSEGYWINEHNVDGFARALERLVAWRAERDGPALEGVSVDLEPAYDYSEQLRAAQRTDPTRWLALLRDHVQPVHFATARAKLARAVGYGQRAGLTLHAVTYPLVLDQPDGSHAVEDAFDVPVNGIDWDEVSFMVYQTAYAQQAGLWFGPSLVQSYATDAVSRFGARAGLDLGIVGDVGLGVDPGDRYPSPQALAEDVAAALVAGIPLSRLRVYSLAGALGSGGVAKWLSLADVEPAAPAPRRAVERLRDGVRALAASLG